MTNIKTECMTLKFKIIFFSRFKFIDFFKQTFKKIIFIVILKFNFLFFIQMN